ncbi:MAG: sulfurtransferase [Synechococcaceae bacterium WB9_2_170]|nr:sulfurtransferase [Synechococcaceae bacterium WB9_2_170]
MPWALNSVMASLNAGVDPLVDVEELLWLRQRAEPAPMLLGMTPRWRFYLRHIPGSKQVWRQQLSRADSPLLISAAGFERWARSLGIGADTPVVIWDERYDATRLWWAFHHYGKTDVRVLNGGLQAWRAAGLPLERGLGHTGPPPAAAFKARAAAGLPMADASLVLQAQNDPSLQLWDTRELEEWSGQRRLRGSARAGRIPWAHHLNWRLFRHGTRRNTCFRSDDAIQAEIERHGLDPSKRQLFYCQSGVRTTTVIFALYRLGWPPQHLFNYDGSWREWSRDPLLPIVTTQR